MKVGTAIFLLIGLAFMGFAAWKVWGKPADTADAPGDIENGHFVPAGTVEVVQNGIVGGASGLFNINSETLAGKPTHPTAGRN